MLVNSASPRDRSSQHIVPCIGRWQVRIGQVGFKHYEHDYTLSLVKNDMSISRLLHCYYLRLGSLLAFGLYITRSTFTAALAHSLSTTLLLNREVVPVLT
jgi:hypothetical protein